MIQARGLRKRFGETVALDGLDLEAEAGTVLSVLGPNGAGKTTAVRILTTLCRPDGGEARVAGHDVIREPTAVQRVIGVAAQDATVDEVLTGRQNLVMIARLSGLSRAAARARATELLAEFGPRRRRRQGRQGLLRRDAPPAGSGGRAGHATAGAVPR